jgi:cytochrome c2
MTGALKYLAAALALTVAVAAMAWAALKPGDGIGDRVEVWTRTAISDIASWYRSGPADGHPDWEEAARQVHGGDPDRGAAAMILYGCGACHVIPGVTGARGTVGPSLEGMARRAYVGGVLPNAPGGMVRWLVDPTAHAPQTAMPDLGVTEAEARDMAAYLFTLRGE